MERNIKNPSLVPEWFIYSGSKVMGVSGADGSQYYFVGSSEKGEDGKTPDIRINAEKGYIWESRYAPDDWNEIPGSPAASGLVGPQGETGLSGDSVKVNSIVNENGGTTVTLAWGENFSANSSFFVPSGLSGANGKDGTNGTDGKDGISPTVTTATIGGTPGGIKVTISGADGEHQFDIMNGQDGTGASYSFDGTTLSGNGSTTDIGVNTDVIATKDDLSGKISKPTPTQNPTDYVVWNKGQGQEWSNFNVAAESWANSFLLDENNLFVNGANGLSAGLVPGADNYVYEVGIDTTNMTANKQYAFTTTGWEEVAAQSNLSAGTDLKIVNSIVQVNTNGIANSAGSAFVEGINTVASGIASHAAGKNTSAYSDYSFVEGYENTDYLITGLIGANHTEGAYNQISGVYSHIEGHANKLIGYGVHMEGGYNIFESHNLTADKSDPIGRWNIWGQSIEGMANATTAEPTSGTEGVNFGYVHGGILKVIGNGTRIKTDESDPTTEVITRSDALILYRDGSLSAAGKISAAGIELGAEPDLSDYIPFSAIQLPIGTNNDVSNYSMGIGYSNTANYGDVQASQQVQYGSLSFGYQNSASKMSFAAGNENKALHVGFAVGYHCTATEHAVAMNNNCSANDYSFAEGNNNKANKNSFAGGLDCIADDYSFVYGDKASAIGRSFAYGPANIAYNYSYLIGRGLEYSGASTTGFNLGAFVIGGWNATTAWTGSTATSPLFIVGAGNSENNKKDAFIVYRNGAVRAGNNTSANESNAVAFGSLTQASGNASFAAGAWCYAIGQGAHAEGNSCGTTGYGNHVQGTFNVFKSTGDAYNGPGNTPVFVGGTLNATTAQNYSDHGGYLQVMGNGTYQSQGTGIRSDAYILYRDGTVSAKQFQNADGSETINGTTYNFTGVDNIEILPNAVTASTANFPNDNVIRIILEA